MREAGRLDDERVAKTLSDYLLTEGIDNQVEQLNNVWVVWVYQEEQLERARAEVAAIRQDPAAKRYVGRARRAGALRKEDTTSDAEARLVDIRRLFREQTTTWRPLTMVLICACLLVAVLTDLGSAREPNSLLQTLFIAPHTVSGTYVDHHGLRAIAGGQVWRLLTPSLIHFGFFHLLFNLAFLYWLGNKIEAQRGAIGLLAYVLVIAIVSNLGQYFASGPNFGGMSGVCYGLLGYTYLKSRYEPQLGLRVHRNSVLLMLGFLLLGFSGELDFANGTHLVGLLMGVILGGGPIVVRSLRH